MVIIIFNLTISERFIVNYQATLILAYKATDVISVKSEHLVVEGSGEANRRDQAIELVNPLELLLIFRALENIIWVAIVVVHGLML